MRQTTRPTITSHCIKTAVAMLCLSTVTACRADDALTRQIDVSKRSAAELLAEPERTPRGIEDDILRIERDVPGFGGFFLDADGNVVTHLADARQGNALKSRMAAYLDEVPGRYLNKTGNRPTVTVLAGSFAFSELVGWQTALRESRGSNDGIVLLDADEGTNKVRVGVRSEADRIPIAQLAQRLGIPLNALLVEVRSERFENYSSLQDKYRPLGAGIQTEGYEICTMGFNVTDSLGNSYFLTAGHCTANYSGVTGSVFSQNTATSGNRVGVEYINPSWTTGSCNFGATYCRAADVALILLDTASMLNKRVAQSSSVGTGNSSGNLTLGTWYSVGTQQDAAQGTTVYKTGRTTGSTSGAVSGTCLDLGPFVPDNTEVTCAYEVAAASGPGDSGAPVYHWRIPLISTSRQADGLLFGGGTDAGGTKHFYYNTWSVLTSSLGRSLYAY